MSDGFKKYSVLDSSVCGKVYLARKQTNVRIFFPVMIVLPSLCDTSFLFLGNCDSRVGSYSLLRCLSLFKSGKAWMKYRLRADRMPILRLAIPIHKVIFISFWAVKWKLLERGFLVWKSLTVTFLGLIWHYSVNVWDNWCCFQNVCARPVSS